MGRKPSRWSNLPKGMRARPRGRLIHYYLDTGAKPRKEIPLGSDYALAVKKWAELTSSSTPPAGEVMFPYVAARYRKEALPEKEPRTRQDNEKELDWLLKFFGGDNPAPLESIEPQHVQQYMQWRVAQSRALAERKNEARRKAKRPELPIDPDIGQVRANREKALLSHLWNFARAQGLTSLPNPCAGIKRYTEDGRDTAPDSELVARVLEHADKPLELAMRLADCIGQRPGDVLRVSEAHISGEVPGGILHVQQGKTGQKLRIVLEGALAAVILEARAYKLEIRRKLEEKLGAAIFRMPAAILINEKGKPLTANMLRNRFDDARALAGVEKDLFQFRDFRAKVATEADELEGTRTAQALLGHTTEGMTERYIRHKVGRKVRPLK